MRRIFILSVLMPVIAFAQSDDSMLVVGGPKARPASEVEQERVLQSFPEWAVTRAGAASNGSDKDVPNAPIAPAPPGAGDIPPTPASPKIPESPTAPVSKLWPADTVPIFMKSCVGYQPKLVLPCNCIISKLMLEMPHDEFLKLTAQNTIEEDIRLKNIRTECAIKAAAEQ